MLDSYPLLEVKTLERMKVGRVARDLHEPVILLRPSPLLSRLDGLRPPRPKVIPNSTQASASEGEKIASLEVENKRLRASLDKAIKLNERMWNGVVDLHLLPENKE
jgi:pre-rRNA-processing protein IPI3